jgi:hypothetical protein
VLSYSLCQFANWQHIVSCKLISVYSIVLFCTSTYALYSLDSCVISVLLNKSKTSNFKP